MRAGAEAGMGTSDEGGKKLGVVGAAIAAIGMMVARGADDCGRLGLKGIGAAEHAAPAAAGDALLGAGKAAALGDDALLGAGKAAALGDPARAAAHAGDGAHAPKVLEVQPGSATEDVAGKLAEQGLGLGLEMLPGATDEQEPDATEPVAEAAAAPGVQGARRAPMPPGAGSADAGAGATGAPAPRTVERRPPAK
ncbi:hypothetical protein SCE1572_00445 [Sorangium cellulosum So0157-2]|uniref:Uncharacterized protein n=2 Tax=Sorangium cellulosum TaxID=56 RepID=S4XR60_SORCE|nr:hypothetical protein SCE1572_00445 [Sorangium cellulosum So0157-2]